MDLKILTVLVRQKLTNIRYLNENMWVANTERKLQDLLDYFIKESWKKGLTMNSKNSKCTFAQKRNKNCTYQYQTSTDVKDLGNVLTKGRKVLHIIQKRNSRAKIAFQTQKY